MSDPWTYDCPKCHGDVVAERFGWDPVRCPACGWWWTREHDCAEDIVEDDCRDYLLPASPPVQP